LLACRLPVDRGFTHLAQGADQHHFWGLLGLHTVVEAAITFAKSRLF
jgi:hypothetical protein